MGLRVSTGFAPVRDDCGLQILASEDRMGEGHTLATSLHGFHPMNPGVEFRQAYRWGLSGPYLNFTKVRCHELSLSPFLLGSPFLLAFLTIAPQSVHDTVHDAQSKVSDNPSSDRIEIA